MWEQYQKTLIPVQLVIFISCGYLWYSGRVTIGAAIAFFVIMQLGGLIGAAWAARLKRRIEVKRGRLPLDKR